MYIGLAGFLLLYLYLPAALFVLFVLFKNIRGRRGWGWMIVAYVLLAYLIPMGDVTWHSWNMNRACKNAGQKVYRTVKVDGFLPGGPEYVSKMGYRYAESRIDRRTGRVTRWEMVDGELRQIENATPKSEWELVSEGEVPDPVLGVTKSHAVIRNRLTGEVIAERWAFFAWKGWVDQRIGAVIDNSAGSCNGGAGLLRFSIDNILIPNQG